MKKDFKNIFMMLVITIALIVMTIGILNGLKLFYPELPDRALFGESTGFVSVIFSGFSVILVIFTLSLQMDDLKKTKEIQSKQIELTTKQILNENNKLLFSLRNDLIDLSARGFGH
jgi:uncharacterized membrane protein